MFRNIQSISNLIYRVFDIKDPFLKDLTPLVYFFALLATSRSLFTSSISQTQVFVPRDHRQKKQNSHQKPLHAFLQE